MFGSDGGGTPEAPAAPEQPRQPLMLQPGSPDTGQPADLHGPYHRLGSSTQTPDVTQKVINSGELGGQESRWGGEAMVQAHDGPIPANAREGSFEFYTSIEPKPASRTPPGYVAWEPGSEKGVRAFTQDGVEWAAIPAFVTEVR